ncbi:MAG: hypothetical protein ACTS6G_04840 [Candidatus Hodgkinia cicadicola]
MKQSRPQLVNVTSVPSQTRKEVKELRPQLSLGRLLTLDHL